MERLDGIVDAWPRSLTEVGAGLVLGATTAAACFWFLDSVDFAFAYAVVYGAVGWLWARQRTEGVLRNRGLSWEGYVGVFAFTFGAQTVADAVDLPLREGFATIFLLAGFWLIGAFTSSLAWETEDDGGNDGDSDARTDRRPDADPEYAKAEQS